MIIPRELYILVRAQLNQEISRKKNEQDSFHNFFLAVEVKNITGDESGVGPVNEVKDKQEGGHAVDDVRTDPVAEDVREYKRFEQKVRINQPEVIHAQLGKNDVRQFNAGSDDEQPCQQPQLPIQEPEPLQGKHQRKKDGCR